MNVKAVFYIDKKRREVLYVPFVCVIINKREPEVILEPRKLKRRQINWEKGRTGMAGVVSYLEVEQKNIDTITKLCFEEKITEAKNYCIEVFDQVANKPYRID